MTETTLVKKKYRIGRDAVIIFVIGVLLFSLSLVQQTFYASESNLLLFAQNISVHGWRLFPSIQGIHYPDQPSTAAAVLYLFSPGTLSRFTAGLPSAICSALTLMLIYLIAAPHSRKWGFCALLFALFTYLFTFSARSAGIEPYLMLITTLCFYLVYAKEVYLFSAKIWWVLLLCILGFLFCGPMGYILPACVIGSYYLLAKRWQTFSIFIATAFIIFVILIWYYLRMAYLTGGATFVQQLLYAQLAGKTAYATAKPFGYYWLHALSGYALSYPIAIIVLLGLLSKVFKLECGKRIKLIQHLAAWAIIILLICSLQPYKHLQNLLPMTPACALIAGYLFVDEEQIAWISGIRKAIAFLLFITPFISAFLCLIAKNLARHRLHENFHAPYTLVFFLLLLLQIIAIIYGLAKHQSRKESMGLLVGTLSVLVVFILVVEPALLLKTNLIVSNI